ncbi:MAG: FGGY-family carbohydrate kinase [Mangrovibacterium sp.]
MKPVIAIFDIGKTNKKVLLFDEKLQLVYQQEDKFDTIADEDRFECDDIEQIERWIQTQLESFIKGGEYDVKAVNFSTYGATLMHLNGNGKRVTPLYNYLKPVSEKYASSLFAAYGGKDEFCRKTASPNNGMLLNSAVQFLWLKAEIPAVYRTIKTSLHFPQYLTYALTGKITSEPTSIGCHTFMWDYDKMEYHQWLKDLGVKLPQPVNNDVTYPVEIAGKQIEVGTGIHDSSASLVPYLKGSKEPFILVSTGTWCITMNPFNREPLTAEQLASDCLCFLTPERKQVKSSRLFMGHFHETWAAKIAEHFQKPTTSYINITWTPETLAEVKAKFALPVYFKAGKESFEEGLKNVDLSVFASYEEAYQQLLLELASMAIETIELVIPKDDITQKIYVSGGMAQSKLLIYLLQQHFATKEIVTSEVGNASALGAALVIAEKQGFKPEIKLSKE